MYVCIHACLTPCLLGDYYHGPPSESDQEPDEEWVKNLQDEGRAYQEWDEDADVDESGQSSATRLSVKPHSHICNGC